MPPPGDPPDSDPFDDAVKAGAEEAQREQPFAVFGKQSEGVLQAVRITAPQAAHALRELGPEPEPAQVVAAAQELAAGAEWRDADAPTRALIAWWLRTTQRRDEDAEGNDGGPADERSRASGVEAAVNGALGTQTRGGAWVDPPGFTGAPPEPIPVKRFGADWWNADPQPRRWLLGGLIPHGRLSAVYGEGEAGKSRLLLQLAAAVIVPADDDRRKRVPFLEADPDALAKHGDGTHAAARTPIVREAGRVLIVSWEDECEEYHRRTRFARNAKAWPLECGDEEMAANFELADMQELGGAIWAPYQAGSQHTNTKGEWTDAGRALLRRLDDAAEAGEPYALAVIDPVAAAFACSEIDRALVRGFLSALDGAAIKSGTTILLAGHPPKGAGPGAKAAYSGSGDWRNGVRGMLDLGLFDTGYARIVIAKKGAKNYEAEPIRAHAVVKEKGNYGPPRDAVWLRNYWQEADRKAGEDPDVDSELAWFATTPHLAARHAVAALLGPKAEGWETEIYEAGSAALKRRLAELNADGGGTDAHPEPQEGKGYAGKGSTDIDATDIV